MELAKTHSDGVTVIAVVGRLDTGTAPDFEDYMLRCIDQGATRIVFDLSGLEFISSAGLRGILATAKRVTPMGGGVAVACATGNVGEVFTISGFGRMMPVVDTVEDAVAAV